MVSYNRDRFLLLATTVLKEIAKTSVLDLGKPSLKATDRWRSAQTMLWSQDLSDFSDSFIKNCLQNKQSLLIYKVLLWKNRTCGSCYYSLTINRISEPRDISYPVLTNQQNHDSAVSLSYLFLKMMNDISDMTSITRTNLYSLWPLLQKKWKTSVFDKGNPSVKVIDRWWSAYANAVITVLVRIMITYLRQTEQQKDCSADVTWSGSNL